MSEDEFREHLSANGYRDTRRIEYAAHHTPDLHDHEFSAMGIITDGELTIVYPNRRERFGVGEWYEVPAGTVHSEHTGPAPATAFLGTKRAV